MMNAINLPVGQTFVYVGPAEWAAMKPSERKREPRYELTRRQTQCTSYRDRIHLQVRGREGSSKQWCVPSIAPVVVVVDQAEGKAA